MARFVTVRAEDVGSGMLLNELTAALPSGQWKKQLVHLDPRLELEDSIAPIHIVAHLGGRREGGRRDRHS